METLKPCPTAGEKQLRYELELSARVFEDYALMHEAKAVDAMDDPKEEASRRQKAKRNAERAASCRRALAVYDAEDHTRHPPAPGPTSAFHLPCPSCGTEIDLIPSPPAPLISDENVEKVARAMFEAWPLRAVSPALASKAQVPVGTALTWDAVLEMGGDHNGLLRLARAALQAISTSMENENVQG